MPSLFTRIINGEIPCVKVHEDDLTLAIMDIHPIQPGQILVIPKEEVGSVWEMSEASYHALMATVQQAGKSIARVFPDKARVGLMVEGLEVADHAHVKVFPFSTIEEFHAQPGLTNSPTQAELKELAVRLAF